MSRRQNSTVVNGVTQIRRAKNYACIGVDSFNMCVRFCACNSMMGMVRAVHFRTTYARSAPVKSMHVPTRVDETMNTTIQSMRALSSNGALEFCASCTLVAMPGLSVLNRGDWNRERTCEARCPRACARIHRLPADHSWCRTARPGDRKSICAP